MHAMILLLFFIAYVVQPTLALASMVIVECSDGAAVVRPKISPDRCSDDPNSDCMAVFPVHDDDAKNLDPTKSYKVHENCAALAFKNLALKCASRCALCCKTPEFNCENDAKADCAVFEAFPNLCNSELVIDKARKECPATCGFCQMRSACNDTIAHCGVIKQLQLRNYKDAQMKQQCMGTCGLNDCLPPICKDEASDCNMVLTKGYCNRLDIIETNAIGRCKKNLWEVLDVMHSTVDVE